MKREVQFNGKWDATLTGNDHEPKEINGVLRCNGIPIKFRFDGYANCTYEDGITLKIPKTIHIKLCYACMSLKKHIHADMVAKGLIIYLK